MADLRLPELNEVKIAGRLTRDPELKYLPSGIAVCELGIASSRRFRQKGGTPDDQREETAFINVVVWGKSGEWCGENLSKGRPVLVEGRLQTDEWEDKTTGAKRSVIKINAHRVQAMDWEDRGAPAPQPKLRERQVEDVPEDADLPF